MESKINLRYMGFCGADDSIHPKLLQILSEHYEWIEWGYLFRPDKEGQPRYPTNEWIMKLVSINETSGRKMKLAGHLCGLRCEEVLDGNFEFIHRLIAYGFKRIQINATKANNVHIDTTLSDNYVMNLRKGMQQTQGQLEWIIQSNEETKFLWQQFIITPESNLSILFDASCGLGKPMTEFAPPYSDPAISCGYAGGIGPSNIVEVMKNVQMVSQGVPVWIDMESSLRVKISDNIVQDKDVFSIEKCFECIMAAVEMFDLPKRKYEI